MSKQLEVVLLRVAIEVSSSVERGRVSIFWAYDSRDGVSLTLADCFDGIKSSAGNR